MAIRITDSFKPGYTRVPLGEVAKSQPPSGTGKVGSPILNQAQAEVLNMKSAAVAPVPIITTQPVATAAPDQSTATFTVVASGEGTLTYQWRKNGTPISGATSAAYTTPALSYSINVGEAYSCAVTNAAGTTISNGAALTVTARTTAITSHPSAVSRVAFGPATFTVAAVGTSLSYQWTRNGSNISGATSATYKLEPTAVSDTGAVFRCVVTGVGGQVTSNAAGLTVTAPAQYFRITMLTYNPGGAGEAYFNEIEFAPNADGTGTIIPASGCVGPNDGDPNLLINGDYSNIITTPGYGAGITGYGAGVTITIALAAATQANAINFYIPSYNGYQYRPGNMKIERSTDNVNWTTVVADTGAYPLARTMTVSLVVAQYFRVTFLSDNPNSIDTIFNEIQFRTGGNGTGVLVAATGAEKSVGTFDGVLAATYDGVTADSIGGSTYGGFYANATGKWMTFILPLGSTIHSAVFWVPSYSEYRYRPGRMKIERSTDNVNWTTMVADTGTFPLARPAYFNF